MVRPAQFGADGEVYFSFVNPGVVKGWYWQTLMTLNYTCPHREIRLVFYDDREGSPSLGNLMETLLSSEQHRLVRVPHVFGAALSASPPTRASCAIAPRCPTTRTRSGAHLITTRRSLMTGRRAI
jgi:hypothetical protein